jgi:dienelactone hydrolase
VAWVGAQAYGGVGKDGEHMSNHEWARFDVEIPAGSVLLSGLLAVPPAASGLVLFAHGSGSSRFSPRNRQVAEALQRDGLATLLLDLLTAEEESRDRRNGSVRFDVSLLASRLRAAAGWAAGVLPALPLGYFGASTGAAAALIAAAAEPARVRAVVSRGGRPDLAADALPRVQAPTLLLVGGNDPLVLDLNRQALARMRAPAELRIIPLATHLFEEPGTLAAVAQAASEWFVRHLGEDTLALHPVAASEAPLTA